MSVPVHLTPMERAVLDLLAQGRSYKQAATALGRSYWTVSMHVRHAKQKAGIAGPVHRLLLWYVTTFDSGDDDDDGGADV